MLPKSVKIVLSMCRLIFISYITAKIYLNDLMEENFGLDLAGSCAKTWCCHSKDNRPFEVMITDPNDHYHVQSKLFKLYHS